MQEEKERQHHIAIDLLRIIAIIAVVIIHTTTKVLAISHYDLQNFSFILFLNQVARFAVPMFFMISGFVLELSYPYHANYISYMKKRFSKIFLPYIFWSVIFVLFIYPKAHIDFVQVLFSGSASYQLYFIPTLLIFYVIFPIIHTYYRFLAKKYVLIFLGILQLLLLYIDYYVYPLPIYPTIKFALLNYFVFLSGVVMSHHSQSLRSFISRWWKISLGLSLFLAVIIFWEGKVLYLKTQNYLMFYSQWRPSILFYTLTLTCVLYTYFANKITESKIIQTFSHLSFFVFFVHVIVLENIWNIFIYNNFINTPSLAIKQFFYAPVFIFLTIGISFFIAYIAHKIPKLAKITG